MATGCPTHWLHRYESWPESRHSRGTAMTTIGDIFDIPAQVHQGDFVLRLTEGVSRPADTLRTYVVTPQLVGCFDQAPI